MKKRSWVPRIRSCDLHFSVLFGGFRFTLFDSVKINYTDLLAFSCVLVSPVFWLLSMQLHEMVFPTTSPWIMSCISITFLENPGLLGQAEISIPFASSRIYNTYFQVKNECYLGPNSLSYSINFKIVSYI